MRHSAIRILARIVAVGAVVALAPASATAQANEPYTLGQGLPLGASGVRLGGYLAVEFEKAAGEEPLFLFDDLSLFVFGDLGARARFFVEVEDSKFWRVQAGRSHVEHHIDLERLYVDYLHGDALKVRVGKFLTPLGTWNEIHPDPLTWTVSRPLATYATFPTFITGLQVFGTVAGDNADLDYVLYAQGTDCLDCRTDGHETRRALGGRLRSRWSSIEIGIPALYFVDRLTADAVTMSGIDLLAHRGPLEVRGEATLGGVRRAGSGGTALEHAWYLQGMYALSERSFLVVRGERARSHDADVWRAYSGAVLFRPLPAMSMKLEFQHRAGRFPVSEGEPGRRVLASFGVLF